MQLPKKFVILDFETTDIAVWKAGGSIPEAIELGAILVDSSLTVLDKFGTLIRPQRLSDLSPAVSAITGLFVSDLQSAPEFRDVVDSFVKFTNGRACPIFSFGGFLDAAVLETEYRRCGIDYPHRQPMFDLQTLFLVESLAHGYQVSSVSLRSFAALFGVNFDGQHRAMKDCEICLNILKKLQKSAGEEFEFRLYEF